MLFLIHKIAIYEFLGVYPCRQTRARKSKNKKGFWKLNKVNSKHVKSLV